MTTQSTPTPELVALQDVNDRVQIALDASDAYWNADDRQEKCLACNGTGKVPCGESQDWCNCDNGTLNNGTEAGAMHAALDAVEATRTATVPQGVSVPDGWVLVPKRADAAMFDAAYASVNSGAYEVSPEEIYAIYDAMLAAVPAVTPTMPCGGCGNDDPDKRCIGCLHSFTPPPAELGKGESHGS